MWYKAAKPYIESGELAMLGVVQEQHAERAELYKQWKQYDFPLVQDSTTQLDLWAVPIPLLIDQHGVVRNSRPRPGQLKAFIEQDFDRPADDKDDGEVKEEAEINEVDQLIATGNLALHGRQIDVDAAIESFEKALKSAPKNGKALFSLGVAYRMRFDSQDRQADDFRKAYEHWKAALSANPNQYIWRRRIEQYGPRLTKPYPFYDWIETAQKEIKARGEKPVELTVALSGTEASSAIREKLIDDVAKNPDPDAKIFTDDKNFVDLSATVVQNLFSKRNMVRIHLDFDIKYAKWNDEGGPMKVWIDESSDGVPEKRLLEIPPSDNPDGEHETKSVDFEFQPKTAESGKIKGFALFHCCDADGVCYYYRKNFSFDVANR